MSKSTVCQGQSFLDKTLELTGSIDNVVAMAVLNGRSPSDELQIGEEIAPAGVINPSVIELFNLQNRPASAYREPGVSYGFPEGEFPIGF